MVATDGQTRRKYEDKQKKGYVAYRRNVMSEQMLASVSNGSKNGALSLNGMRGQWSNDQGKATAVYAPHPPPIPSLPLTWKSIDGGG